MNAVDATQARPYARRLGRTSAEFAGQIAVAVWLRKLTEEAAREALQCYARACHCDTSHDVESLLEALVAEYRGRREQQDLCW